MRVIAGHKSSNLVELTFHGRSAHSSLTPQGVNAVEYAARAVTAVRALADRRRTEGPFDQAYVATVLGHADPRTTRRYDRDRHNLDRDPAYAIWAARARRRGPP